MAVIYDLMDALHEVPNIPDRWGTPDNVIEKLRLYFGYFHHEKWKDNESLFRAPNLVQVFNDKLLEYEEK